MDPDSDGLSRGGSTPGVTRRGPAGVDAPGPDILLAAIEATRMPMVLSDPNRPDNPIVFANRAFVRMTGYERSEIVGRNCRFLQGPETDADTVERVRHAVRARDELAVELLNYRKDGTSFWNALFVSPVFDPAGNLVYFFASQLDVSRRRAAEEALRRSPGRDAMERRAGGIAHDLNNMLQVISGNLDGLRDHAAASRDPRLIRRVDAMSEAATRAAALTRQLLGAPHDGEPHRPVKREAAEPPRPGHGAGRSGSERILVVDDRAEVAGLARTMLEDIGYAVEVARNGEEALDKLRSGFALLFSDLVMPGGLDGVSLAREAQRRHPELRVLLTTGHANATIERTDAGGRAFDTLSKPYRRADLARTVRAVLDGPAGVT